MLVFIYNSIALYLLASTAYGAIGSENSNNGTLPPLPSGRVFLVGLLLISCSISTLPLYNRIGLVISIQLASLLRVSLQSSVVANAALPVLGVFDCITYSQ